MQQVSVAMATYNGAAFLGEQLASIRAQTLLPSELVVCDDGSTDDAVIILEEFARTAPFPVRIERNEKNLGHADNFLKAASLCRSPLVAYCDQDDVWAPKKLEIGADRIIVDNSLIALHQVTVTDCDLVPMSIISQGIKSDAVLAPLSVFPHAGLG